MKLKLDAEGHAVLSEGKPVYVYDDGREVAFDAPATVAKIGQLNGEAKSHRERAEAAEAKNKAFEGITDPAAAKDALEKLKNIDAGKLQSAEAVETRVREAVKAVEERYAPVQKEAESLRNELYSEKIGGSFARSTFLKEKVAVPVDIIQASLEKHFKIEDGKIVPYDGTGNKIFSRTKPGEIADFEEAVETLVMNHAQRDSLLRATGGNGGGARQNNGTTNSGPKTISRAEFNQLPPASQAAKVTTEGFTVVD